MTIFNLSVLKTSSVFSGIGVILGTVFPGIFVIILGVIWVGLDNSVQIHFSWPELLPDFARPKTYVFLAGKFLSFGGLEVSAVHAKEVKNPQKDYPRAMMIAAFFTFFLFVLGSLSICHGGSP